MRIKLCATASVLVFCLTAWGCSARPENSKSKSAIVKIDESGKIKAVGDESANSGGTDGSKAVTPSSEGEGITFENPFETPGDDGMPLKGLAGRWLLAIPRESAVSRPWLIEITETDGKFDVTVVDKALQIQSEIKSLQKEDDRVIFELSLGEKPCSFAGLLANGRVQGTLEIEGQLTIAWLERTRAKALSSSIVTSAAPGLTAFDAAQRVEDPAQRVQQLQQFAERFSESPLAFDSMQTVLRLAKAAELSEEQVREVAAKYQELAKPWGARWAAVANETVAYTLGSSDSYPAIALEFAEQAKATLTEESSASRKQSVDLALAIAQLRNDRAADSAKLLDELLAGESDNREVKYYRALASATLGDLDAAVDTLADLWPHPLATRELERIWKERNGSLAGLEERLDVQYAKRFPPLAVEPYAGRPEGAGDQVALVELFTGTSCPPCVPADLAFEALGRTFKRSDVVLLQFHLHVPGPDPLANGDAESRAEFYRVPGTPYMFVNGKPTAPMGGRRQDGAEKLNDVRGIVEKELERKGGGKIELAATRDGDELRVEAKVTDAADAGDKLRLRIALVEESVRFTGMNGVRLHHAVVRAMIGGVRGVAVNEVPFGHNAIVNLAEVKASLEEQLGNVEKQFAVEFPAKPLDLERLAVVAFLQDDATSEVVQSVFVTVASPAKTDKPAAKPRPADSP